MSKKSPKEVLKSISEDLKKRGLTHAQAATLLGYANVQSVSNLLSTARKNITYLPQIQASRYNMTFGYSIGYLTTGEGELLEYSVPDQESGLFDGILSDNKAEYNNKERGIDDDEFKYRNMVNFVMNILTYSRNPYLIRLFEMYCDGKNMETVDRCLSLLRQLNELPKLNRYQFQAKMAKGNQSFDKISYRSIMQRRWIISGELERLLGISESKKMY